ETVFALHGDRRIAHLLHGATLHQDRLVAAVRRRGSELAVQRVAAEPEVLEAVTETSVHLAVRTWGRRLRAGDVEVRDDEARDQARGENACDYDPRRARTPAGRRRNRIPLAHIHRTHRVKHNNMRMR